MSNNVERKYRKPLSKNGWMAKLQRLAFGSNTPEFVGYCPFFWFTWLCLLILPVALVVRPIAFIVGSVAALVKLPKRRLRRPPDTKLVEFYKDLIEYGWERLHRSWGDNYYKDVFAWIQATPDWGSQIVALYDKAQERAARSRDNAAKVKQASRYASYIIKPFLVVVSGFAASWMIVGLVWLIRNLRVPIVLSVLQWLAFFTALLAGCVLIVGLWFHARKWWKAKCPDKIRCFFSKIGDGIETACDFFVETIGAFYIRECPLIEWTDSSGPISRNDAKPAMDDLGADE